MKPLKDKTQEEQKPPIEIVVSTYWPTRIIKTISVKDSREQFAHTVVLSKKEAEYLYHNLDTIFNPNRIEMSHEPIELPHEEKE